MSKIADSVMNLVAPIAEKLGLEVVEVVYEKKYDGMNLTVFIDKDGGVSIDDCEKLHRAIDEPLDRLDPIEGSYTLNVSSLGIDRPLKTDRDFKRNLNKKITVKLYSALNGKKKFSGVLLSFDDASFVLDTGKEQMKFNRQQCAHIEPVIEF